MIEIETIRYTEKSVSIKLISKPIVAFLWSTFKKQISDGISPSVRRGVSAIKTGHATIRGKHTTQHNTKNLVLFLKTTFMARNGSFMTLYRSTAIISCTIALDIEIDEIK